MAKTTASDAAPGLDFLGQVIMPQGQRVQDTAVGGLSALAYDPRSGRFLAVSDDRGDHPERGPSRLYELTAKLSATGLGPVEILTMHRLEDQSGYPFAAGAIDAEGMALLPDGRSLIITSEGGLEDAGAPFIGLFDRSDFRLQAKLPLPPGFAPTADGQSGARPNLSLEGVTLLPDGRHLVVSLENALRQDGPQTSTQDESPARITVYDLGSKRPVAQYVYDVGRIPVVPPDAKRPGDNGISDILALDAETLLVMERGYTPGIGNTIRLYSASFAGAQNVLSLPSLKGQNVQSMRKTLLLDMGKLGVRLDNVEAIAFGPRLPDGRRTLLLVSDDNFNPSQRTIFFALALTE